ncbi:efflux RND transporter periplasmic adaptor subunit [Myxococcota bacterium]|nr:efflux RND transporter periplasmic adaptor subunit [Myxococcota bacterium]
MSIRNHALVLLGAVALTGCHGGGDKVSLPAVATAARGVRVAKPAPRIETSLARATGTLRSREDAVLSARGTGQIKRILVDVGDRVRKGQPLVELDSALLAINLENARALERLASTALASAERDFARGKGLFDEKSMTTAQWEKVQTGREMAAAQHDQAKAALKAAEQQLADATIVAPFDGMITARHRSVGDTVTMMPVTPILAITNLDRLEARLAVPEAIEAFVKPGATVVGVTTPGNVRFEAKVRVKSSVVDPASRTIEVLADVARAEGLRPGTLVNVDFGDFAGDQAGLFIPASAVRGEGTAAHVLVAVGGKAEKKSVEVAPVHPGIVAVKKGLEADSDVILDPGMLAGGEDVVPVAN